MVLVVYDKMVMNQDLTYWLVQNQKSIEKELEGNVFEDLGLSVKYKDWLIEGRDSFQSIPGKNICTEADEGPAYTQHQIAKASCSPPSFFAIKPIDEITTMSLDYWLYRTQMSLSDQKSAHGKRKLDQEEGDEMEADCSKQKRI